MRTEMQKSECGQGRELTNLELEAVSGGAGFWETVKNTIEIQTGGAVNFHKPAFGANLGYILGK